MVCVSISDFGLDACKRALKICEKYRKIFPDLVAEIRLDLCGLNKRDIYDLFSNSKIPLMATCNKRKSHLYVDAVLAGATYVDINLFAYKSFSTEQKAIIKSKKVKKIFSFYDYFKTLPIDELISIYRQAVEEGADIVKIITTASSVEEAESVLSLYTLQRKGKLGKNKQLPLIAYAMGDIARYSCLEANILGSPFIYCALRPKHIIAPGMFVIDELEKFLQCCRVQGKVAIPASKSIVQRAIIAAVLAKGKSEFHNFSHCNDINSAVAVAKQFSNNVNINGDTLTITGAYPFTKKKIDSPLSTLLTNMSMQTGRTVFVGESGLLSRLCIPIMGQIGEPVTLTGEGNLLDRSMSGCKEAIEELGASCVLTAEETLPALINGPLKGGKVTISGKKGSQFISGLLMALPLCKKDSVLTVKNPTSIHYILITLHVISRFGINISYRSRGNSMIFNIPGKQKYSGTEMTFEGDWSSAANFIVMGAVFGDILIKGLNLGSMQAEKEFLDIVDRSGAIVERYGSSIRVRRGHLTAFETDVTNFSDLLIPLAILAVFSEGVSSISGINHVSSLDNDRLMSGFNILKTMGVEVELQDDVLKITGISLFHRMLEGKMLRGGSFSSSGDHRLAMGLLIISLGVDGKVSIDNTDCIAKSFPEFIKLFDLVVKK